MKCSEIHKELWRFQVIKTSWKGCCDSPELLVGLCSLLLAYVNTVAAVLRCHRRPRTTVSLEICLPSFFLSPSSSAAAAMPFHLASNQLPAFRFTKSQSRIVLTGQLDADRFDKPGRFGERSLWPVVVVVVVVFKLSVQERQLRERAAAASWKRNKTGRLSH